MCGIVAFTGRKAAAGILLEGLKKLEYRGYDSAGIALIQNHKFDLYKRQGRVKELDFLKDYEGKIGIGHTRWATHGAPSAHNAHPHVYGKFAIVHNGIIENYAGLKEECLARGEKFESETDSEIIAHLLQRNYKDDLRSAVISACRRLKGSYALAILCLDFPDQIVVCRNKSPLVVGRGLDGSCAASDLYAISSRCNICYYLKDGEFALLTPEEVEFFTESGPIFKKGVPFNNSQETATLSGYSHFMRKEMQEIPAAISKTIEDFNLKSQNSTFYEVLCQTEYMHIIGCGTAYHSGLAAKYAIEALARIPVETTVASEFRYSSPIIPAGTVVLAISQSGETADTLAAAELAKGLGAYVIALTNENNSTLTRIADFVLETKAGKEIAVAATKSFNAQLACLYAFARALAKAKGRYDCLEELRKLSALAEETVSGIDRLKPYAMEFAKAKSVYYIGRGADYCAALEGSLKLKEISYLPSEGYPAGELKHGTLALVEKGTPVVAVMTEEALAEKTMNAICEVYARGAKVLLITSLPRYAQRKEVASSILIPCCDSLFSPILSVIPLQALAYFTALEKGNDPDKPRNLAKSVTVE